MRKCLYIYNIYSSIYIYEKVYACNNYVALPLYTFCHKIPSLQSSSFFCVFLFVGITSAIVLLPYMTSKRCIRNVNIDTLSCIPNERLQHWLCLPKNVATLFAAFFDSSCAYYARPFRNHGVFVPIFIIQCFLISNSVRLYFQSLAISFLALSLPVCPSWL